MNYIEKGIMLSALGDIVGFANGRIEFNGGLIFSSEKYDNYMTVGSDYSDDLVFRFITNGGFTHHPRSEWHVSDDTLMLLANCRGIIEEYKKDKGNMTGLINSVKNQYISLIDTKEKLDDFKNKYYGGNATIKSLLLLKEGRDYKTFKYDENSGGSGSTMRVGIIGALVETHLIIPVSIETTLLTHVNGTAILGAVTIALFASYASTKVNVHKWPFKLMEVLNSTEIDDYINSSRPDIYEYYMKDKVKYINMWEDYIEDRFKKGKYLFKNILAYPSRRSLYYSTFSNKVNEIYPGAGADDSAIISYDIIASSCETWEKVVTFSMLHVGDSDTTGAICGLLYGLAYDSGIVSEMMIDNIGDSSKELLKNTIEEIKKTF